MGKGPVRYAKAKTIRPSFRIDESVYVKAQYWADRAGLSVNQYMVNAVEESIARDSGAKPREVSMLTSQMNQVIDHQQELSSSVDNLYSMLSNALRSFVAMTRGDNYLIDDDEDGELVSVYGQSEPDDGMFDTSTFGGPMDSDAQMRRGDASE